MLVWFDRHFSIRLPAGRFIGNTLLLSIGGLLPVLALYIAGTPGFWGHLAGTRGAFGPFLRQVVTNGLPAVVAVNWVGLILFARLRAQTLGPFAVLTLDFGARIVLFALLHGAVFAVSALVFGAFGGDPAQAIAALGPTLARAAAFGNLAGVYLYATLVSALPLHMALIAAILEGRGRLQLRPFMLVLPAAAIIAVQFAALTGVGRVLGYLI